MSGKTLNFDELDISKNKFISSKQPIVSDSLDINKIVW